MSFLSAELKRCIVYIGFKHRSKFTPPSGHVILSVATPDGKTRAASAQCLTARGSVAACENA